MHPHTTYPQGKRILIVDSDPVRREHSKRLLADEGFAVAAVAQGLAAIRLARSQSFELTILAVDLPGSLDGQTTLRHLRSRQPGLRALFTGDLRERPLAALRDTDDFIAAPFNSRDLLGCVFELLEREIAPRWRRDIGRSHTG